MPVRQAFRHRHHGHGNVATRRTVTRRDRAYAPGGRVMERVHVVRDETGTQRWPRYEVTVASAAYVAVCCVVSAVAIVSVVGFARAVWADVSRKTRARAVRFTADAATCARDWEGNGCGVDLPSRTTVLEGLCREWAACVEGGKFSEVDAMSGTVWAEAIAEILNAFANSVNSWSAVVAVGVAVVVLGLAGNCALSGLRDGGNERLSAVHLPGRARSTEDIGHVENSDMFGDVDGQWTEVTAEGDLGGYGTVQESLTTRPAVAGLPPARLLHSGDGVVSTPKCSPPLSWMRPQKRPPVL